MHKKVRIYNFLIAIVPCLAALILVGLNFDYYYDLNDDVLMKDILSGVYSGLPISRNIQMLYPISLFISLLYKINMAIPWYGIILCAFQYGSLLMIILSSLKLLDGLNNQRYELPLKAFMAESEVALIASLMLNHLANVQYTITVAFMAGAAIMYILSLDEKEDIKNNIITNIPVYIIVFLGFLLRSEMMLLMLPFILLAYAYKLSFERDMFKLYTLSKYASVVAVIIALLGGGLFANKVAYSSNGWNVFTSFFDGRTKLYDYQVLPRYEENKDFYTSIGLTKEEVNLFDNYNFAIDDEITDDIVWKVADYAALNRKNDLSFVERLKIKLRIYIYQITHGKNAVGSDYPYNMVAGVLYVMILAICIGSKKFINICRPTILFMGRSLIWMYILMGDRSPERITHSLYFVEIVILTGLLIKEMTSVNLSKVSSNALKTINDKKLIIQLSLLVIIILLEVLEILPVNAYALKINQLERMDVNAPYVELYRYMEANNKNNYFLDVYSTVSYSERMFSDVKNISKSNSEFLGGWYAFSPSACEKIAAMGYPSIMEGMLYDNAYFVKKNEISSEWIGEYYKSKNIDITLNKVDDISGVFEIYEIRRK